MSALLRIPHPNVPRYNVPKQDVTVACVGMYLTILCILCHLKLEDKIAWCLVLLQTLLLLTLTLHEPPRQHHSKTCKEVSARVYPSIY